MSKPADVYRLLYLRLWRHEAFRKMKDSEKLLAIYMLSGPQTNRIGCYYFSPALAAEDLGVTVRALTARLRAVSRIFGWEWRESARLFYVPSWLTWNRPNGMNATTAWRKEAERVPDQMLSRRLTDAIAMAPARPCDAVVTQDQEQEQDQELPPYPPVPGGRTKLTRAELKQATETYQRSFGSRCHHEPPCPNSFACIQAIAEHQREMRHGVAV